MVHFSCLEVIVWKAVGGHLDVSDKITFMLGVVTRDWFRRFLRTFCIRKIGSSVVSPLTALLQGKPKKPCWFYEAQVAFECHKNRFTTAPILHHPNTIPFVGEVDASSYGIGAVLSQWHGTPAKLLRKLTLGKTNYDVGNRGLLSIEEAWKEWCYLLEGPRCSFQVITDHKNLEYLKNAKHLNLHQV